MIRKNKKDSHSQLFGSMAIAILIGAQYLNTILGLYINSSEEGYLTLIIGIVTILSVISFIYRPNVIVNIKYPALLGIIIVAFLLTVSLTNGKSDLSIADFLGMCLVPLICGGVLKPDFKKVLSYCMCMIILSIPVANDLFAKSNMGQEYDAIKMNVSYAIIPIIGAGILHFFFYRKESNIFEKLLYVVLALITMMFVAMSYRGALVALMVVLFAGFMLSGNIKWRTIKRTISIIEVGIKRFFEGDYVSSLHVLVPKFESTVRELFEKAKFPTTSMKKTSQHEQTFNAFLDREDVKLELNKLGKDFHKVIQIVMISQTGMNLRNDIAHGLIPYSSITKSRCIIVIYLFLTKT